MAEPRDAVTHYAPEEPDQPACDADTAEDAPAVMFGTLNPQQVTCPACTAILSTMRPFKKDLPKGEQ
jgi:hypothetical protein